MLAIAKSQRSITERDLIRKESISDISYSKISSVVKENNDSTKLEIHYQCTRSDNSDGFTAQKYIRVNNSPKKSSDLIGILNAVIFTVNDLDIIYGRPSDRRKYLDILISQVDKEYLKFLREYSKITTQRNHLLKLKRNQHISPAEMEFWDDKLSLYGSYLINKRIEMVKKLTEISEPIHRDMSGINETLDCIYQIKTQKESLKCKKINQKTFKETLKQSLSRDIALGSTTFGPHRDDLIIRINKSDANRYASRGQSRTAILSLKLAEAQFLKESRLSSPVLLLDDILSELDFVRREKIVETIRHYEQCIITSAEPDSIPSSLFENSNTYRINQGAISW